MADQEPILRRLGTHHISPSQLMETRHLSDLDAQNLERLGDMYRAKLKPVFSTRTITPHYIPGLDLDLVAHIKPRVYIPDDAVDWSNADKAHSKSGSKRLNETPPRNHAKDRTSDQPVNSPVLPAVTATNENSSRKESSTRKGGLVSPVKNRMQSPVVGKSSPQEVRKRPLSSPSSTDIDETIPSSSPVSSRSPPAPFRLLEPIDLSLGKQPTALAAIIEEERRAMAFKVQRASPFSLQAPPHPKSSRKFIGVKLKAVEDVAVVPDTPLVSERPRGNPWNKTAAPGLTLMEVMTREEKHARRVPVAVPAPSRSVPQVTNSKPWNIPATPVKSASVLLTPPTASPVMPVGSFLSIQREEKAELHELQRSRSRPLNLIQLEERAVDELLEFYGARDNPEEWIGVERVLPKVAAVSWYPRSH